MTVQTIADMSVGFMEESGKQGPLKASLSNQSFKWRVQAIRLGLWWIYDECPVSKEHTYS